MLDAVAVGMKDDLLGERVVLCVLAKNKGSIDAQTIVDYCREHLAPEKTPNNVYFFDDFPRGPAGKIELQKVKASIEQLEDVTITSDSDSNLGTWC